LNSLRPSYGICGLQNHFPCASRIPGIQTPYGLTGRVPAYAENKKIPQGLKLGFANNLNAWSFGCVFRISLTPRDEGSRCRPPGRPGGAITGPTGVPGAAGEEQLPGPQRYALCCHSHGHPGPQRPGCGKNNFEQVLKWLVLVISGFETLVSVTTVTSQILSEAPQTKIVVILNQEFTEKISRRT
jgi:hypothetical protein